MSVQADFEQTVDTVYQALTDPEFLAERNLALGEISAEYEVDENKDGATVTAVREVRRVLPGVLAKLFDPVSTVDITETWRSRGKGWAGEWRLQVREQPVTVTGKFELVPSDTGCRYRVKHQVRAKVPFLSGQVEKFVRGQTARGATDELDYLRSYLD